MEREVVRDESRDNFQLFLHHCSARNNNSFLVRQQRLFDPKSIARKSKNAFRPELKAHQNFKFQNVLRIKADPLNIHHRRTQVFNLLSSENALFMMCNEWERVFLETVSVQNVQMFAAVDLSERFKVNEAKRVSSRMFIGFDVLILTKIYRLTGLNYERVN